MRSEVIVRKGSGRKRANAECRTEPVPKLDVEVRLIKPSEKAFVIDGWLKNMIKGSGMLKYVPAKIAKKHHIATIEKIIGQGGVYVAYSPEDEDHVLGFIVFDVNFRTPVIHFAYVKKIYRKFGVATELLRQVMARSNSNLGDPAYFTQLTTAREARMFFERYGLIHNPYLFMEYVKV